MVSKIFYKKYQKTILFLFYLLYNNYKKGRKLRWKLKNLSAKLLAHGAIKL